MLTDAMPESRMSRVRISGAGCYNEDLLEATIATKANNSTRSAGQQEDVFNASGEMQTEMMIAMNPTLTAEGHAIVPRPKI